MGNEWLYLFFLYLYVRDEVWGTARRLVVTEQRVLNFSWFTVAVREQITEFWTFLFGSYFVLFLIFFCLNYQMVLIWQKKRMFLEVKKLCKRYYISAGMVYEIISSVTNFVVFCFEECWIDCFICYTIKLKHPIKRLLLLMNQWFISI